jgi:Organic solute transporter Ostalpha
VLGRGNRNAVVNLLAAHADHLSPPFRLDYLCNRKPYENDRDMASAVLLQCQAFALQFVFMRPSLTIAMFVLDKYEYYGPTGNPMDYRSPQFYIVGAQNLSVFIAFTGLMKFYHAVDKELAWCRPFAKFLCIKGVVFMTFWQGLAISLLANTTDVGGANASAWAKSAQNFLICLEMLLFSIAHFYTFPTNEWEEGYRASHESNSKFGDSIALGDFMNDLKLILRSKSHIRKSPKKQPTVPEVDEDNGDANDEATQAMTMAAESESSCSGEDGDAFDVRAIEEGLVSSLSVDDPDIEEATARLLASKILDNEDWDALVDADESIRGTPRKKDNLEDDQESMMGHYMGGSISNAPPPIPVDDTPPSERTGLLSGAPKESDEVRSNLHSSQSDVLLRPSIFTAVAEITLKSPIKPTL